MQPLGEVGEDVREVLRMELKDTNPFLRYGLITLVVCLVLRLIYLLAVYCVIPCVRWVWSTIFVGGWNLIVSCLAAIWHFVVVCVSGVWHFAIASFDFLFIDIFHQDSFLATIAALAWRSIVVGIIVLIVQKRVR